jgi:hypothetical protein
MSSTTGSGCGEGCAGRAERRSPFCRVGRHRTDITVFLAGNKPGMKASWPCSPACRNFFLAPTILAWDWVAAGRNLLLEANSP